MIKWTLRWSIGTDLSKILQNDCLILPLKLWDGNTSITITKSFKRDGNLLRETNIEKLCVEVVQAFIDPSKISVVLSTGDSSRYNGIVIRCNVELADNNIVRVSGAGQLLNKYIATRQLTTVMIVVEHYEKI